MSRRPTTVPSERKIATYWWEVMPAIPEGPNTQEHHALRRIWGDHTYLPQKGRGLYCWGSEDNLTAGLFQLWAIFDDPASLAGLARAAGLSMGEIRSARWAYSCNEDVARGAFAGVSGHYVAPDIVLHLEDAQGAALVAFEAKRPGNAPVLKDADKLAAYQGLLSMQSISRRAGCFLVGQAEAPAAETIAGPTPVLTWERMREFLREAVEAQRERLGVPDLVAAWIDRAFARYGIGSAEVTPPIGGSGAVYGTAEGYRAVDALSLPPRVARFLKGSEAVEAFWQDGTAEPPLEWLRDAPSWSEISLRRAQQGSDRRVCRWSPIWRPEQERSVP